MPTDDYAVETEYTGKSVFFLFKHQVGKFLGALEGGGTVMRTFINRSQFEKLVLFCFLL